jgi:hypothetical protein
VCRRRRSKPGRRLASSWAASQMKDGGQLGPGREALSTAKRPPSAARSGQILARRCVVGGPGGGAAREGDLDGAQRLGDVEMGAVQLLQRPVVPLLQPCLVGVGPGDPLGLVQHGDRLVHAGARADPVGLPCHLRLDPAQLVPAPGIGLGQVDVSAEGLTGRHRVPLGTDSVAWPCQGRIVLAQVAGRLGISRVRRGRRRAAPRPRSSLAKSPTIPRMPAATGSSAAHLVT